MNYNSMLRLSVTFILAIFMVVGIDIPLANAVNICKPAAAIQCDFFDPEYSSGCLVCITSPCWQGAYCFNMHDHM